MQATASPLTHARIAKFYVPLAMSWVFMAVESPVCVGVISRLPAPELNTAAFNILMSIALFIETPIIDLLSTSTTLSKNQADFALISRFTWYLMLGTAFAHALLVFTPLYGLVTLHVMGLKPEVAHQARLGLALMIPWSPAIAWRRYRQGLLIRFHRTRMVGYGTFIRVSTIVLVNLLLYFTTRLPGVVIAGLALTCAVTAEAIFAQWASSGVVNSELGAQNSELGMRNSQIMTLDEGAVGDPMDLSEVISPLGGLESDTAVDTAPAKLTMRRLVAFHSPLVLTTMVILLGAPTISAFLSKAPDPVLSLASWQVAFSLLWLFRTATFALPEVVITLYKDEQSARKLREFCIRVGVFTSGVAVLAAFARLDVWFFSNILKSSPPTAEMAHLAFLAASPLGLVNALQSYVRGMLTAHHLNVARFAAVTVGMAALIAFLILGLATPWRGVISCALAMDLALIAELGVLVWSWKKGKRRTVALANA